MGAVCTCADSGPPTINTNNDGGNVGGNASTMPGMSHPEKCHIAGDTIAN